jgi:hypothetical protein
MNLKQYEILKSTFDLIKWVGNNSFRSIFLKVFVENWYYIFFKCLVESVVKPSWIEIFIVKIISSFANYKCYFFHRYGYIWFICSFFNELYGLCLLIKFLI